MKILYLGVYRTDIIDFITSFNDQVVHKDTPISDESEYNDVDFIISYGYRYILKGNLLQNFSQRAINLHISLLPWNRGADPNLWSFLEDTPKGVTIHYIDEGIDTGDILAQQDIRSDPEDTLRTSYERLSRAIEALFKRVWLDIRDGSLKGIPQSKGGSFHRLNDRINYEYLLTEGWDTPVKNIVGKALNKK